MSVRRFQAVAAGVLMLTLSGCIRFGTNVVTQASPIESERSVDVALADVDGDGRADPIVLTSTALVRLAPCGTGCLAPSERIPFPNATSLHTADLDGDGADDVVVGSNSGTQRPRVYFGASTAVRPTALRADDYIDVDAQDTFGLQARPFGIGDFNGDGSLDLALVAVDIFYRVGDGNGGFDTGLTLASYPSPRTSISAVEVGDIDANGDDEIITFVVGLAPTGVVSTLDVYLAAVPIRVNNATVVPRAIGDLDRDGRDDIIGRSGSTIAFLRSTGTGLAPFPVGHALASPPLGLTDIVVADLNADTKPDLIATDSGSRTLSWWNGLGDGSFAAPFGSERLDHTFANAPSHIAFGDVDGDGLDDVLLANPAATGAGVTLVMNNSVILQ